MSKKNKTKKDDSQTKQQAKSQNKKAAWFDDKLKLLLSMLEFSTPHGDEVDMHKFLPEGGKFDTKGNYMCEVGKDSKTLFCCHIDTVGSTKKAVEPIYENGWIRVGAKDAPCLGGDDRCGMLCLLHLIEHKIPGTYFFHVGEERGLIGARHIEKTYDLSSYERAVEFDRRGETSVITEMGCTRTCSDDFADALCNQLGYGFKTDEHGVSTDVRAYEDTIAECTNISVGYRNEHSSNETVNADFLINDLLAAIIEVDWESLPTKRDPKANNKTYATTTYRSQGGYYAGSGSWNGQHGGHNDRNYEWEDYESFYSANKTEEKYRKHTVSSFSNHSKVLRKNGVIENCGDLMKDSDYVECELCGSNDAPFKELNIVGTDYLLCKECVSFLLEGWDPDEYSVEKELGDELECLMDAAFTNMEIGKPETDDEEEE